MVQGVLVHAWENALLGVHVHLHLQVGVLKLSGMHSHLCLHLCFL